ncbi:MAG: hypothetical protein R3C15_03675 [Thermoleophilia bacterium]
MSSNSVAAFVRDQSTGALTQLGHGGLHLGQRDERLRPTDGSRQCPRRHGQPDGKNVYAAAAGSNAVAVFSRNATTGELMQLAGTADASRTTAPAAASTGSR